MKICHVSRNLHTSLEVSSPCNNGWLQMTGGRTGKRVKGRMKEALRKRRVQSGYRMSPAAGQIMDARTSEGSVSKLQR